MSEAKREQLSTLIDGELDPRALDSVLRGVETDPRLRTTWDHYHLIGEVLRGEAVSREVQSVALRVRERLGQEPTVLAPLPLPARSPRRWVGPVAGSALAASAALLAFLAGPALFDSDQGEPLQMAQRQRPEPRLYVDATGTYWNLRRPEVESKLNGYLVEHQEYAPSSGIKGMLPYASFVSYDVRR